MTADQLSIFNGALRIIGERKLASLTEAREPGRVLNDIWTDGAVNYCLEQGLWKFAIRAVQIDYDAGISPAFGYTYAFDQPNDLVRIAGICSDEFFNNPLTAYVDEAGYWYSNLQTIYARYVSNDSIYGSNLSLWPETFKKFVEAYLALQMCERIVQNDEKLKNVMEIFKRRLSDALAKDAMKAPATFLPLNSWNAARHGRTTGRPWARGEN